MKIIHIKTALSNNSHTILDQSQWKINKSGKKKLDNKDLESNHFASWSLHFAIKTREYRPDWEIEIWQIYDVNRYGDCGVSVMEEYNLKSVLFPSF